MAADGSSPWSGTLIGLILVRVTHRKLDELLAALPETDHRAIRLEDSSDEELDRLRRRHDQHHTS